MCSGSGTNVRTVGTRSPTLRAVHHQVDLTRFDEIDSGRAAGVLLTVIGELAQPLGNGNPGGFEDIGGSLGRNDREPEVHEAPGGFDTNGFVAICEGEEYRAGLGQRSPGCHLALGEGSTGVGVDTHNFAG